MHGWRSKHHRNSMEIRTNFIEKSVVVRIAGLLGIKGDFELRNIITDY